VAAKLWKKCYSPMIHNHSKTSCNCFVHKSNWSYCNFLKTSLNSLNCPFSKSFDHSHASCVTNFESQNQIVVIHAIMGIVFSQKCQLPWLELSFIQLEWYIFH